MNTITNLNQKKAELISAATNLVENGLKSAESREAHKKLLSEIDATQEHLDMLSRIERAMPGLPSPAPVAPVAATPESREQRRAKLNAAWRAHLLGHYDERIKEQRDLLTSSDGQGGAVVSQEFSGFLSESLKWFCPLFNYANVRQSTNGRSVKIGRVSDQTHGLTLITEGSSTPVAEVDPSFSSSVVSKDLFTSGVIRFSNQLLSDSFFDLETLLTNLSASRVGRGIETLLTLGTVSSGTATPNNPGLLSIAQIATTTSALASGIGWSDLIETFDALDVAYLPKAVWLMSSKVRNYLAGLEDSTSRPYFVPAPNADGLDMLLGKPVVINNSLAQNVTTANSKPILFGNLVAGLQVVSSQVRVQTLSERFAEFNESALIVSTRIGSQSLQLGALQVLKLAAS